MAAFLKQLLDPNKELKYVKAPNKKSYDWIKTEVDKNWYCYHIDRTGKLNKYETFTFLKFFLKENNLRPVSS